MPSRTAGRRRAALGALGRGSAMGAQHANVAAAAAAPIRPWRNNSNVVPAADSRPGQSVRSAS